MRIVSVFEAAAILVTATALFAFVNARYLKLPTPIGVTLAALVLSLGLVVLGGPATATWADELLTVLDFDELVLRGLLSFLLFAGALFVDLSDLLRHRGPILALATIGLVLSTLIVGGLSYVVGGWLGVELPFAYALLFGALISPTDPIAVLAILKRVGVGKDTEALITGESLFNDGVAVVVFTVLLSLVAGDGHGAVGVGEIALLFVQEALGGVAFGMLLGFAAYRLLGQIDDYTTEILITLAVVTGGYAAASWLHTSGPLAVVVAGLFIGNRGRLLAMSARTRAHLDSFWELVDEVINAILFVLIGIEVLVLKFTVLAVEAAIVAVPLVLLARLVSVSVPISLFRFRRDFAPYTTRLMVWGGLRGGISIALALALPAGPARDLILTMTYGVVVFSILVQGLTVGRLARRSQAAAAGR
ncbi:MAG: sodium:proton antiporter [Trueperaceae bacterium]|nr:sodium:proton antiporter [Trueperaceae bacterium]